MSGSNKSILILGIGNYLLGDEGVGVHVVRSLEPDQFPKYVDLLDGGTGGLHLLGQMSNYDRVILIDATCDGSPAGTIKHIIPKYSTDYPSSLSAHDIGLKDVIESLILLERLPKIDLITVSVNHINDLSVDLSPELALKVPEIIDKILRIL